MLQNYGNFSCRNFAALEGSPHENGYNSGTKSRKMLPKVAKRPKRRGLGTYNKKPKFLGQNIFWPFLAFFGHFLAVFGWNFMKERHLSKKSFLTFVHIVIDYTKPFGIVWNSKKKFLWTGLMNMVRMSNFYKLQCYSSSFWNQNNSKINFKKNE